MKSIRYFTLFKALIGFFLGISIMSLFLYPFETNLPPFKILLQCLLILGVGLFWSLAIFTIDWFPFVSRFQALYKRSIEEEENGYISLNHLDHTESCKKTNYKFVGASVAGKGHRDINGEIKIPCQDSHSYKSIGQWSLLIVADGAGSYENSKMGSTFCVEKLPTIISSKLRNLFDDDSDLPAMWRKIVKECFEELNMDIKEFAKNNKVDYHTLGCTVNMVVFNETHLFAAHIGDGRAAYKKQDGVWEALITPFKGDEPGSTVFLTSDYTWENLEECLETKVITPEEPIEAMVLLSDGMETYSFLCYTKDEAGIYSDPNEPFVPFLDGNLSIIRQLYESGKSEEEVLLAWENYLQYGKKLADEYDDKTMVIAFKV